MEPVWKYVREIERFESLSPEEMREVQFAKLRALLAHAYKYNPYHRQVIDRLEMRPESFRTAKDLARLPFLTKSLIKSDGQQLRSNTPRRVTTRSTSGSSGVPLILYKDHIATAHMDAQMYHMYEWYGIQIGSRQARVWGMPLSAGKRLQTQVKDFLLNRRRMVAFDISDRSCQKFYSELLKFKPYFLYGLINPIHAFCNFLLAAGLDPSNLGIKVIVTTGERSSLHQRLALQDHFNCPVVNEYGCTESGIIALQCERGNMHVASHNLIVEVVDRETGDNLEPDKTGEVVITELHSFAMPIIRYRLGDLTQFRSGVCDCGRKTPLIGEVQGRISELIRRPDGSMLSCAILDYSMPQWVSKFRAVQRTIDGLILYLECSRDPSSSELDSLRRAVADLLGAQMNLEVIRVDEIPFEPSGKLRCFVSELK